MLCKYNARDYQQRLGGGIIFYDGAPFVVTETYDNYFTLQSLKNYPRSERVQVDATSNLLDLSRQPLGYINFKGNAYYLLQDPNRQYKQSLSASGLHAFDVTNRKNLPGGNVTISSALFSTPGYNMLMGIYPTLESSFDKLEKKSVTSVGISRNVAIAIDSLKIKRVFYKQVEVGYTTPDLGNKIIIPSDEYAYIISRFLRNFSWEVE